MQKGKIYLRDKLRRETMNYRSLIKLSSVFVILSAHLMLAAKLPIIQDASWHYEDKGITSPVHKKHVKQIVWSKKAIEFDNQEKAVLETSFKLTDPIYGRIFLECSIRNTPIYSKANDTPLENTKNSFEYKVFIDGKNAGGSFGVFEEGFFDDDIGKTWTTWQFSPHLITPETEDEKKTATAWEKAVRGLSVGDHSIRFELWGVMGQHRSSEPLAQGSFTLLVSKGESIATVSKFPQETYSGNDAVSLGKQLRKALTEKGIASSSEIKKLAITSNWVNNRYTDSKKEYRKISAAVLFSDKDNDGVCRFVTYNFISDKNGNGWTTPRFHSFCNGCPEGDINCSE